jgi:lipopolysaccharide export system protein LptC
VNEALRRNAVIVFFAIIVATSVLYILNSRDSHHRQRVTQDIMDSFMHNVSSISYGNTGAIKDTFNSSYVTHYPDNDTTHAVKPHIVTFSRTGQPWYVTADKGTMTNGDNNVHMQGHVNIHQPPGEKSHNVTFTTSALNYYPNRQYADTDQPVTVVQPGTRIDGVGMTANLNTGDINLLHQSRGEYDPSQAKK